MNSNIQQRRGDLELATLESFLQLSAQHFELPDAAVVSRSLARFPATRSTAAATPSAGRIPPAEPATDRYPRGPAAARPSRGGGCDPSADTAPAGSVRRPTRDTYLPAHGRAARGWPHGAMALIVGLLALYEPLPRLAYGATPAEPSANVVNSPATRPPDVGAAYATTTPPARELLDQKHILVAHLVSGSPLARRIEEGDNWAAKGYLTSAREALARAQSALADEQPALADREFDAAIRSLRAARERVPPPDADQSVAKARFAHLMASVQALRAGYAGLVVGGGGQPGPAAEQVRSASALIEAAHALGRDARYAEASERLHEAQTILLAAYQQNLDDPTVVYPRHFADPATQFEHELARFNGYRALVPIAIDKLDPAESHRNAIAIRVADATRLEARAREHAARGNWQAGLTSLDQATAVLDQALSIAGLTLPTAAQDGQEAQ